MLFALACGNLTGPSFSSTNLEPLEPPLIYRTWYNEVRYCLNIRRDYDAIEWYVADELILRGDEKGGVWRRPNRIALLKRLVYHKPTVKHEMIHYIRQKGDHEFIIFWVCSRLDTRNL